MGANWRALGELSVLRGAGVCVQRCVCACTGKHVGAGAATAAGQTHSSMADRAHARANR